MGKNMTTNLMQGDCLEILRGLDDNSADSVVTDPPYGLGFMGKKWDIGVPAVDVFVECLRVLKPGGHLLAFGGSRTYHRLAVAVEDAGFDIRDQIMWVYGSGFPKSQNVSKAIDKASGRAGYATKYIKKTLKEAHDKSDMTLNQLNSKCGFEASGYLRESSTWSNVLPPFDKWVVLRDAIGLSSDMDVLFQEAEREVVGFQKRGSAVNTDFMSGGNDITAPATDAAKQWDGWGTALKPAHEPIVVARKPLEGTVAANVIEYGTGAINIDGCRVEFQNNADKASAKPQGRATAKSGNLAGKEQDGFIIAGPIQDGERVYWSNQMGWVSKNSADIFYDTKTDDPVGSTGRKSATERSEFEVNQGAGRFPANLIHDGSDETADLLGSAARFFYCAKASKKDRGEGNNHPTVKPTDLMCYLVRLVTPPNGTVLDPFMGSGSTGKACMVEGFRFIGIELDEKYYDIANERIMAERNKLL